MNPFKRAIANNYALSMALMGGPGTGKTYTSLRLASHLGERVCLIDAERGRAGIYAREFAFDTAVLPDFAPRTYLNYLQAATRAEYDVIIIDGISPEWDGDQGCLQWVDDLQRRGMDRARAWAQVTPAHELFVREMLACPCHLIVTIRARERTSVDKDSEGRSQVVKLGVGPIQQDRILFEFPLVGVMDQAHSVLFTKSLCHELDNQSLPEPGEQLARTLLDWLDPPSSRQRAPSEGDVRTAMGAILRSGRWTSQQATALMRSLGGETIEDLTEGERRQFLSMLNTTTGAAWASQQPHVAASGAAK